MKISIITLQSFTGDVCMSRKGLRQSLKIDHRFHFTSNLKRMSVIATVHSADTSATNYIVAVKGAPETLRGMVSKSVIIYCKVI